MAVDRAVVGERARSDDALTAFVVAHYDRLIRLARLVCRDGSDAADAVQVGLEQAWRRRSTLRDEAGLRPWLDRIVTREAIRISQRRRSLLGRLFRPPPNVTWVEPADHRVVEPSLPLALHAAFDLLSSEQRAVIALHLHAGYSVAETAVIVSAPEETVRSRLRSARRRLRAELEESGQ
jgi:RNA polymerase sigma-70 factor (ECF subfamily)